MYSDKQNLFSLSYEQEEADPTGTWHNNSNLILKPGFNKYMSSFLVLQCMLANTQLIHRHQLNLKNQLCIRWYSGKSWS